MAEDNQENVEEQKSSKKLIIIIVVLLLIIAGGGAAFFLMGGDDSAAQGEDAERVDPKEEGEEIEQSSKEIIYYDLEQPLRVNFPKGSGASLIEIKVTFLIDNEDTKDALIKHEPMIVNNLLMIISAAGADKLKQTEGKNELRASMLDETGKVMEKMTGKNRVREVFFTSFVMQ